MSVESTGNGINRALASVVA